MVSTFTPNIQLEEPARGDDVGTWDTPVNANTTLIDLVVGGVTTISLNNSNVVLSAAQFQCNTIAFNSTLTGSVIITFPTSFTKCYNILNQCTGSSAFTITLTTTGSSAVYLCPPPRDNISIINIAGQLSFQNLGRVGSYWDYAGSSIPNWVSGCSLPPYLNCDGTTFSSAAYPALATVLGGNTLPDSKGRQRLTLDQSAGRLSSATIGFSPNTVGAAGGSQNVTLTTSNLPPYTPSGTITSSEYAWNNNAGSVALGGAGGGPGAAPDTALHPIVGTIVGTPQGGVSLPFSIIEPAYIGGLTLIRSA
jgi:microcystin-dependent protein